MTKNILNNQKEVCLRKNKIKFLDKKLNKYLKLTFQLLKI
jgi:hypothetical protein